MAYRKRVSRKRTDIPFLDESILEFLISGEAERDSTGWSLRVSRFFDGGQKIAETRKFYKDELLAEKRRRKYEINPQT